MKGTIKRAFIKENPLAKKYVDSEQAYFQRKRESIYSCSSAHLRMDLALSSRACSRMSFPRTG